MRTAQNKKGLLILSWLMVCSGCATLAPALTSLALSFGQDLLAAASVNHAPRYAVQVEGLLASLASVATGLDVKPQLAAAGYTPPPAKYQVAMKNAGGNAEDGSYVGAGTADNGYGDQAYSDEEYVDQGYNDSEYNNQEHSDQQYGNDQYSNQELTSEDFVDQSYSDPGEQPQEHAVYGSQPSYSNNNSPAAAKVDSSAVSLNAVLLVQRQGQTGVESVADGDVLRDGGSNPAAGDKLKVQFQANCRCYVYIIAVDATGYVAQIFPDAAEGLSNPVDPQQKYSTPGTGRWWALDGYKGTETLYFVAAQQPRADLEQALAQLAGAPRQLNTPAYQPVMQPAVLPQTRGLVKVSAMESVQISATGRTVAVQVDRFTASLAGSDLAVTRWFRHQ